jgi:uncharacterized protein (DUF2336 family)
LEGVLAHADEIMTLARSRDPADRERLLTSVADLCDEDPDACLSAPSQAVLTEIFMNLVSQAEWQIRQRLANRLAPVAWAPPPLISVLALDDIEIARPVIARSPILKDQDLIRLLVEATLEHQIEVARRPGIGAMVVNAILDQGQPSVLIALAGNAAADVSPLAMQRLVAASQRIAGLRGSLAQHPKLTAELAQALYGWVGEALRASIADRYAIDPELLRTSVEQVAAEAAESVVQQTAADLARERELMERRLVDKLNAADQLRPAYLLRALREGRLLRFEAALSALGGYPPATVKAALTQSTSDRLALACAGVGIDRSVYPTNLSLVRSLNSGRPFPAEDAHLVLDAFNRPQADAAALFRRESTGI